MPALPLAPPFPFYTGTSSVSSSVPGIWPAALDGMNLMIEDTERGPVSSVAWTHRGIQLIRTQADGAPRPSERSLNPEGFWRRAQESWHRGAGQVYQDKENADEFRFRDSKGINPWTPYQIGLLPATDQKKSGASTNYYLATTGTRLYLSDGTHIYYTLDVTADSPTWVDVTGYTGGAVLSIASDGYTVYITDGSNVWTTDLGGTTAAVNANTLDCTLLAYVKGRLMAANGPSIYNISVIGTPPSALFTHANANFAWVGFAEGRNAIYAAGYSGDKSLIYRTTVKTDGTALDAPIIAGELPDGEIIRSISGYLGFILLGTDLGIRFCDVDTNGNLNIGPYIPTVTPVRCFEPQDHFVWFGWTNYDTVSTGLGRLDLIEFTTNSLTEARTPAYASDLMATVQGNVLSIASFQSLRVFTVSGSGVWAQDTPLVASGTFRTGLVAYGLPDPKTAVSLDVRTGPLAGSWTVELAADEGSFSTVGSQAVASSTGLESPIENVSAEQFEARFTLTRSGTVTSTGPSFRRWTLKATPGASDGPAEYLQVPFLFHNSITLPAGEVVTFDVASARDAIKLLRRNRRVVTYQEDIQSHQVQVENFEWHPEGLSNDVASGQFTTTNGIMFVQMKVIS